MNKLLLFGVSLALVAATPAVAADMAVKAPLAPPPPPPQVFSWTGFYIGGFVGDTGRDPVSTPDATNPATVTTPFATYPPGVPAVCDGGTPGLKTGCVANYDLRSRVIAGGTIGYNWQFGSFVTGLEAEVGSLRMSGSGLLPYINGAPCGVAGNPCIATMSTAAGNVFGTMTARFGVTGNAINSAWSDHVLLYTKVGAAITKVSTSEVSAGIPGVALPFTGSGSDTIWGLAAGAGIEWALDQHWSVKAEYEYLGFDRTITGCGVLPLGAFGQGGTWCTQTTMSPVETGKLGVNYRF